MIHVFAFLVARRDRSHAEFRDYWRHDHIPSVTRLYAEAGNGGVPMPDMLGYHQNPATEASACGGAGGYDGFAEFWLEDEAAFEQMLASGRVAASVGDDPNFLACPPEWTGTRERVLLDGHGPRKLIRLLRRRTGVSREAFRDLLAADHAERMAGAPGVAGYARNLVIDAAYRLAAPKWDAIEEFRLAEGAALPPPGALRDVLDAALELEVDEAVMAPRS
ncbi:MAG: EthD domain-containing protein [Novosphingobium sp.]|nr:EthD domain-containing protein [Novosphingobium sp.]